jgi:hypothetical protein
MILSDEPSLRQKPILNHVLVHDYDHLFEFIGTDKFLQKHIFQLKVACLVQVIKVFCIPISYLWC